MAFSPITSWQIDGITVETVTGFILLGSKITADGDYSLVIKRHLLLEGKAMRNLDSILKSRDIKNKQTKKQRHYFANTGPYSQSYGFSSSHVWMWVLDHKELWAPKDWCFWIVVLRRLLRIPWTAKRSNKSILKEINSEYSPEELMLKLQSFGHLMQRADWLEKTLMLGRMEGGRRGRQRIRWLYGITESVGMSLNELWEMVKDREMWHTAVHRLAKSWTQLSDWTTTNRAKVHSVLL